MIRACPVASAPRASPPPEPGVAAPPADRYRMSPSQPIELSAHEGMKGRGESTPSGLWGRGESPKRPVLAFGGPFRRRSDVAPIEPVGSGGSTIYTRPSPSTPLGLRPLRAGPDRDRRQLPLSGHSCCRLTLERWTACDWVGIIRRRHRRTSCGSPNSAPVAVTSASRRSKGFTCHVGLSRRQPQPPRRLRCFREKLLDRQTK